MIFETLHNAGRKDLTKIRRAFGWVVAFRDFPAGSYQIVRGAEMMTEAVTFFTKGRAEFYLDGIKRGDRVPGILSSEYEPVGTDGEFKIVYVEPTSRVCIPAAINGNRLPTVKKVALRAGDRFEVPSLAKYLVCLGSVLIDEKTFEAEQTFKSGFMKPLLALEDTFLLEFV